MTHCWVCMDKGFVREGVLPWPCPGCNPDSGFEPGEYEAQLVKEEGRCGFARGGGGRTCPLHLGHKGNHVFMCGH
jgi:hypothetical protein